MLLLLLLKKQKWKAASFICAGICGNEFKEVDFNKDTSMMLNLPIHFEWLQHWHLFHLMKSKLILNNTVIMLETFTMTIAIQSLIILRTPKLVSFVETHLKGHPFLHRHYGTCFIELFMKLREQITAENVGTGAFKLLLGQAILHSGILWTNWYRSNAFIVLTFFKFLVVMQHHQCDDSTSMQIKG